ncbi:LeoA/HP0731 family dynamin-like GTPase [Stenotrophomonas sp. GZD-301]|uniref:LeoA/HP0731 family dynamin-like GTPase n=1 Tax=Stenotrophomonas sp. GZD-301 TaxID=3404814 RepID=UPI003BB5269A
METTLSAFKAQQSQASDVLGKLIQFLERGSALGIALEPSVIDKLAAVRDGIAGEKLKVALIGGFSEGKTSIAAAWLEQLDEASMKISHQESSNEVKVYDVGDDFTLIDTPGLFGFKDRISADTHEVEKYKDITRRYVSQAHLVLYVMNSVNPVKESHRDELNWLFRTLDLLPRTVFVLSRFDDVADVEDEQSYQAALAIKRDNVAGRLTDLLALDAAERADLSIVAVAANPFDMGLPHWLSQLDTYHRLSRIAMLQQETRQRIARSGGAVALVEEARRSVIRDVLDKQLPVARQNDARIAEELQRTEALSIRMNQQLVQAKGDVSDTLGELRGFVADFFAGLILQAKGVDRQTFNDFYEREIGADGIMLSTHLQKEFEQRVKGVNLQMAKVQLDLDTEVNHINAVMRDMGKQGLQYVLKGNLINNGSVLAARDGIVGAAKALGMDSVGKALKFKPWGAVKFAKAANGALVFVGAAVEIWDSWNEARREQAFQTLIATMVTSFEDQRADLLTMLQGEQAVPTLFPDYQELAASVQVVQAETAVVKERRLQFQAWNEEALALDAEFKRLPN